MNRNLSQSNRTKPCDLCNGTEFQVVCQRDRRRRPLTTVICTKCGLISHDRIPSDEELRNYYEFKYRHDYHGEYVPAAHRVLRAWEGGQHLVERLSGYINQNSNVFEVGAGIGCTVKSFEMAGHHASGIEPGEGFQKYGREQIGANVSQATLSDIDMSDRFDLVILMHVIEHLNSPCESIRRIRRMLKDGGFLYIECPNIEAPHAAPGKMFHYAHIYNFTLDTLNMLLESCGFRLHQSFTNKSSRTHSLLFAAAETSRLEIIPGSYESSLAGIFRHNLLTYHLRPSYLRDRMVRDVRFFSNRFFSRMRVRSIFSKRDRQTEASTRRAA